jgi:hypothetical protein
MVVTDTARIAEINDAFRKTGLGMTMTQGVLCLEALPRLLQKIAEFSDFNEDNDPYGEHDFGSLNWYGERILWKIDYYDRKLEYGGDPLSPDCRRVITVMLASEY